MDAMLDLETMNNQPTAAITQIALVIFDRYSGEIRDKFCMNVDARSCVEKGMTLGADTIYWWLKQSDPARQSLIFPEPQPVYEVLQKALAFLREAMPKREDGSPAERYNIWCHANFDYPILINALQLCSLEVPWDYRSCRDLRTLVDLSEIDLEQYSMPPSEAHNALLDCLHQIKYTVAAINRISCIQRNLPFEEFGDGK